MTKKTELADARKVIIAQDDQALAQEAREIVDVLVGQLAKMITRDLVVQFNLDNGAQSGKVTLNMFRVEKRLLDFSAMPPQQVG